MDVDFVGVRQVPDILMVVLPVHTVDALMVFVADPVLGVDACARKQSETTLSTVTLSFEGQAGTMLVDTDGAKQVPVANMVVLLKHEIAVAVPIVLFIRLQSMTVFVTVTLPIDSHDSTVRFAMYGQTWGTPSSPVTSSVSTRSQTHCVI